MTALDNVALAVHYMLIRPHEHHTISVAIDTTQAEDIVLAFQIGARRHQKL